MIPAKGTRRELAFARRAMRAARYHLAMARTGLRGADDALLVRVARTLVAFENEVTGVRRRVGTEPAQLELRSVA
jgi:hypothetical protein